MNSVSKNIKKIRLQRKLTQEEMAGRLFVTRQTVSSWENGKSQPDIDMLLKIADALSTDASALIYGIPDSVGEKKEKRQLALAAGILLLLGVMICFLNAEAAKVRLDSYSEEYQLLNVFVLPLFWLVVGWVGIQGLAVLGIIKPVKSKYAFAIHSAVLVIVLLYAAVMLPDLIQLIIVIVRYSRFMADPSAYSNGFSYASSLPHFLWDLEFRITVVVFKQPVIFLIPGVLFRLSKPVKQEQTARR